MKTSLIEKIKIFITFRTVYSKIIMSLVVFIIVILFFMNLTVTSTITNLEEDLIANRLVADINYIEDLIGENTEASWRIKNDAIYYGDVLIGDGTEETANLEPFLEHQLKTGTLSYVFILDKDAKLKYVGDSGNAAGYQEGHYKRVAGSTRSPDGKSIVGTYISKEVSDELDTRGSFFGEANVAGGLIFCHYKTILDENREVIGAMVVGRNITELKKQIGGSVSAITSYMFMIVGICSLLIIWSLSRWTSSISVITKYLQLLERGIFPEEQLMLKTRDEMTKISESINKMVLSLKENSILRKRSETDALTGIPNRFSYDYYVEELHDSLRQHPTELAVEILDIDYFKQYNDNYGHQEGDKCLQQVAEEIRRLCEEHDNIFCSRYGGDEFVLIYTGYSRDEVESFVKTLQQRIKLRDIRHSFSEVSDKVTISQGVCVGFFHPGHTVKDYFNKADEALYDIKKVSRDHYGITGM